MLLTLPTRLAVPPRWSKPVLAAVTVWLGLIQLTPTVIAEPVSEPGAAELPLALSSDPEDRRFGAPASGVETGVAAPAQADAADSSPVAGLPDGVGAGRPTQDLSNVLEQEAADLDLFSSRLLAELYRERGYRFAWSIPQVEAMLALAEESRAHGLEPREFRVDALRELVAEGALPDTDAADPSRWRAELLLSDVLLRYLHHLQYGQYNPRQINPDWTFVESVDAALLRAEMHAVLAATDLVMAVDGILPKPPFYERLKQGYQRYLALAEAEDGPPGLDPIPAGANLRIGMRDPRVHAIRDRLARFDGYRFAETTDADIYDRPLYEAVRGFQRRSGLAQDGIIGPRTLAALNTPLQERLASTRANLERMRWLYHELPEDYLLVDIAAFQLELVHGHEPVWSGRVIIGTNEDQTPMFRDEMEHLVFNPTWSVPPSIQREMRSVPSSYRVIDRRTGRRVYPSDPTNSRRYRLVQPPGPKNALGRVKFMFPNGHAIYLHDTPSRHLFKRAKRAYSHGCVRVDEPMELAHQLLGGAGWDRTRIDELVATGRTRYVNLDAPLPVLLYYLTARADTEGRIGFRPDLYDRDARLLAAMDGTASASRIVFNEPPEPLAEPEPTVPRKVPGPEADAPRAAAADAGHGAADRLEGYP